jgi:hypothetical protein
MVKAALVSSPVGINDDLAVCPKCKAAVIDGICNCKPGKEVKGPPPTEVKASEESTSEEPKTKEGPKLAKEVLAGLNGAPPAKQIEDWKAQYGKVYTLHLDREEIYVWRYLNRAEWQALKTNEELVRNEDKFQEYVVQRACLWPRLDAISLASSRAGLVNTLFSVILQGSYFMSPEVALTLVEEL